MDPNAALEEIRSLILRNRHSSRTLEEERIDNDRFYELVEELDRWLSKGGFAPVAWNRPPGYVNPVSGPLKKLDTLEDLFAYLKHTHPKDKAQRDKIHSVLAAHPDAEGLVVFRNLQMDSSAFGLRTTMVVGPSCTYKSIAEVAEQHLYDLPSQRQYPVAYYKVAR